MGKKNDDKLDYRYLYETLLHTNEGIIISNSENKVSFINEAARKLLGISDDPMGKEISEIKPLKDILRDIPSRKQKEGVKVGDSILDIEILPLRDKDGGLSGVSLIISKDYATSSEYQISADRDRFSIELKDKRGTLASYSQPLARVEGKGNKTLLFVGDDDNLFNDIKNRLGKQELEIERVNSGEEALDRTRQVLPDIVLIDVESLDMQENIDKKYIVQVLNSDPNTKDIPIVILSGSKDMHLDKRGNYFTLERPIDWEVFIDKIKTLLVETKRGQERKRRILIVDDEPNITNILTFTLEGLGYDTSQAFDGTEAFERAIEEQPDLILLDIMLPTKDGYEVFKELKDDRATNQIPIIFVSALGNTSEKIVGLRMGADDYIAKPFSSKELEMRVVTLLKRRELEIDINPTSELPGPVAIGREVDKRIERGETFVVLYSDIDDFKAYNDTYGFVKGDSIIRQTSRIITEAVAIHGNKNDLIGHIGGDDFIIITTPDKVEAVSVYTMRTFDKVMPLYYDAEARTRGYIEAENRKGQLERYTLMSISLAAISNEYREITRYAQVGEIAVELKNKAKKILGSALVFDQGKGKQKILKSNSKLSF